jgi:hypothetical protein
VERPVETITYDRPAGSAPQRAPPAESFAHLPVNETVEIVPEAVWEDPSFYEHIGEELTFEVDLVPSLRGPSTARTRSARPPLRPPCPAPPLGLPPRRVGRPPVRATSDAFPVVPPSVGFSALAGLIQLTQEWPKGAPFGDVQGVQLKTKLTPQTEANQTVRLDLGTKDGVKSMRIGFTDQRLTAHGGIGGVDAVCDGAGLREQLRAVLPHTPTSPNAYDPCDTALGFIGGILCGADKLARVAHLAHDPAVAEVLGIEAIPSQSTLSRFFAQCGRSAGEQRCRVCTAGPGRTAEPDRGLHARSGFIFALARGRSSGRRAGRLHPQGAEALSSADYRRARGGAEVAQLLAAAGQHGLRQRGGHVPRRYARRFAAATSA